jgi:hypothetical protein
MNRRTDLNDGEADTLAGTPASPFGPPSGPTVIPFRRAEPPSGPAAGDTPPVSPAFVSLGSVTQAVVMRMVNNRVRLNVMVPADSAGAGGIKPAGTSFDGLEE